MTLAFLVILLLVPFGLASVVWDFILNRHERSKWSQTVICSGFALAFYGILHGTTAVDFRQFLESAPKVGGKVSSGESNARVKLSYLLEPRVAFGLPTLCLVLPGAAGLCALYLRGQRAKQDSTSFLGRTFGGSDWTESTAPAFKREVVVQTIDPPDLWAGILNFIPERHGPGSYLRLDMPARLNTNTSKWDPFPAAAVLVASEKVLMVGIGSEILQQVYAVDAKENPDERH